MRSAWNLPHRLDDTSGPLPPGRTSSGWYPVQQHGHDAIVIEFARADCRPCPSRDKCTTAAKGRRMLTLRPRELH
ncbi:transposase, partial [Saccharothrix sp. ST-888]|uniref:transposase n=1 Tax=Saccharothrix sp. ST-888 TaxID=1427391 RepID=UPI000A63E945